MAGNEITLFEGTKLPAHVRGYTEENITSRGSVPQLSIKGKVWRILLNGEEEKLVKKDSEGDLVPVQIVNFIAVQHNQSRSRSFFKGSYKDGESKPPTCWSTDGVTPDENVPEKQSATCAKCPKAAKGSRISEDGRESVACAQFKRVAILTTAAAQPDADKETKDKFPPMLLKLPQTSLWDKETKGDENGGWWAWDQFLDNLRKNGVKHTGLVVVKAKFDPAPSHPKVLFKAARFVTAEEFSVVEPLFTDETVAKLLAAPEFTPAAAPKDASTEDDDGDQAPSRKKKEAEEDDDPPPKRSKRAAAEEEDDPPPKKAKKEVVEDDDPPPKKTKHEVIEDDDPPPKKTAKAAAPDPEEEDDPPVKPKKQAKPDPEEEDDPPPKKAKKVVEEEDDPPPKKSKPVADEDDDPPPKKAKKEVVEDEEEDPPAKKSKPQVDDDDDPPPKKAAKPATAAAKKDTNLSKLLEEWPDKGGEDE